MKLKEIRSSEINFSTLMPDAEGYYTISNEHMQSFSICASQPYQDKKFKLFINGTWNKIELGKSGMFEVPADKATPILIRGVRIPSDLNCIINYTI